MKNILSELRIAALATLVLTILVSGIYPALVWGVSQIIFPNKANGSLIYDQKGDLVGSSLLAQPFTDSTYFHPRPSAAGNGYDAANSGGSNLGPLSQKLMDVIHARVEQYRQENGLDSAVLIPADAVTSSSSGLDPHISPANAELQAPRVANARGLNLEKVQSLVQKCTELPQFGILGDPAVNVLELNLALDKIHE